MTKSACIFETPFSDISIITKKPIPMPWNRLFAFINCSNYFISGTIKSATMLMTLIIGLIAGPAVSL